MKQGYLLVLYFYLLASNILRYMLTNFVRSLINFIFSINQISADDSTLYLNGLEINMNTTMSIFTLFYKSNGAKINCHKSYEI